MPVITIPDQVRSEFLKFVNISDREFDKLFKTINKLPPGIGLEELHEKLEELDVDYIKVIESLFLTFVRFDLPSYEFTSLLYDEYVNKAKPVLDEVKFKKRFNLLFGKESHLRVSLKAWMLTRENQKTLIENRVITEVRPVFSSKKDENLIGSVIVHQLKFLYQESNKVKTEFYTLDKQDLIDLRSIIERALRKQEILEKGLSSGELKPI